MSVETGIVDKIIYDIVSGKYKADCKLPSENELSEKYNVPRMTIRKAYERLQEMGYIYAIKGKGSYLKDRQKQIPLLLSGSESFSRKMTDKGYNFKSKNIFCQEVKYNKKIFENLEVTIDDRVFKIGRLRIIDDRPIALHISYVSNRMFSEIESIGGSITSMFEYYKSKGYNQFASKPSILSVAFPTSYERKVLECENLIPLLILQSGCID